ncbi:MAG: type II toxin-antitoxin system HicA family toxin [Peptococcaceae bacterium]|nr:type II toxin-antitoxin system HicA family toxin [Peptococcaceae bacterium]
MTAKELKRKLKAAGWQLHEGAKHTLATNPDFPGVKITIPRGSGQIPKGTLDSILKAAGLK